MKKNKNTWNRTTTAEVVHSETFGTELSKSEQSEAVQKNTSPFTEEYNKIVRRYSFDDNGGGYLGL